MWYLTHFGDVMGESYQFIVARDSFARRKSKNLLKPFGMWSAQYICVANYDFGSVTVM